jgi:omega-amidase
MDSQLTITALQTDLFWENKDKNLLELEDQLGQLTQTDLVILPEMFSTGFTMNSRKFAESMQGPTLQWMLTQAKNMHAALAGSVIILEDEKIVNRFLFVSPDGEIQFYDKRHTFTLAGEHKAYASGSNDGLVNYKGWKISLRICYDLRFPVWNRNTSDYEVLIFTANWPSKRINAWDTLLQARAIENMAYVVGVNRIGTDGSNLYYPGHTKIIDYMGKVLGDTPLNAPTSITQTIFKDPMYQAREKLNFLKDRDPFTLQ